MCHRCNYSKLLEDAGLTPLPSRLQVLKIVGDSSTPLSAQEIFSILQRSHPLNRVTLYRILDLLVEYNLIERISTGHRSYRYDIGENPNHPRHPHFYCTNCGHMECLDPESVNLDISSLQKKLPLSKIYRVEIRLDGICKSCLSKLDEKC